MSGAGRHMQVFVEDGSDGFMLLAGLRTKALRFKSAPVDITDIDSPQGWQALLPGGGVKSANLTGEGVFAGAQASSLARAIFFAQDIRPYRFTLPAFGTLEGDFLMTGLSYSGRYDGEALFDVVLASSGPLTFTPIS